MSRQAAVRAVLAVLVGFAVLVLPTPRPAHAAAPANAPAPTLTSGNASLGVSWAAVTATPAVDDYDVQYREKGTSTWSPLPDSTKSTALTASITGLTNGKTYEVQVRAGNLDGDGPWSAPAELTAGLPGAPDAPTAAPGDGDITVTWAAADGNGSTIDDYDIQYRTAGTNTWTGFDIPSGTASGAPSLNNENSSTTDPIDLGTVTHAYLTNAGVTLTAESVDGKQGVYKFNTSLTSITFGTTTSYLSATTVKMRYAGTKPTAANLSTHGTEWCSAEATGSFVRSATCTGDGPVAQNGYIWAYTTDSIGVVSALWNASAIDLGAYTGRSATVSASNGTAYEFRVRASSPAGQGGWSAASTAVTAGAPAAPAAPTLVSGNAQLTANWSAPDSNGSDITDYDVRHSTDGSTWTELADNTNSTAVSAAISTLTNGTSYQVQVRAGNTHGDSPWSPSATLKAGLPAKPAAPTLTVGNTKLTATWTAPANNGSALTGFKVRYKQSSASTWSTHTFSSTGSTTSTTITGLTNATAYDVQAAATNTHGDSPWSASASGTPTTTAPGKAAAPPVQLSGANVVLGAFSVSDNGGSATTDWDLRWSSDSGTTWTEETDTTVAQAFRIVSVSAFSGGQSYVFSVRAQNAVGTGAWSDSSSALAIPARAPAAPAPTLVSGDQSLAVSWDAPDNNGAAISDYDVQYSTDGSTWTEWNASDTSTTRSASITGLTNGTSYQVQARATNTHGDSAWSASATLKAGLPGAPAAPVLASASATSLTADWSAPASDGGSAITDYDVRHSSDSGANWTELADNTNSTNTSATISTLTTGTAYQVQVRAQNTHGNGPWSVSATLTPGAPAAPAAPTLASGNASITVSWTAPANNGAALTGFKVRHKQSSGSAWTETTVSGGSTTTTTITTLTNGTSYDVQIAATNSRGTSAWSPTATIKAGLPAKPTAPALTAGKSRISLTWTAPANNGLTITDYDVRYKKSTDNTWAEWKATETSTTRSATITGLGSSFTYNIQVRAENSAGPGPWSASASLSPDSSAPEAPAAPTLAAGANASLIVSWVEPEDNDFAITDYDVRHSTDQSTWTELADDTNSTTRSATVTGLTAGTLYYVQVRAGNGDGDGAWSPSASLTAGAPATPAAPAVTAINSQQVGLAWNAPADNGSSITDYDVRYSSDSGANWTEFNASNTSTALTATVTGLTNGTSYQIQVRAQNSRGNGAWSPSASATPGARPTVPTLTLAPGDSQFTANWSAPPSGETVTHYHVRVREKNTQLWDHRPAVTYDQSLGDYQPSNLSGGDALNLGSVALSGLTVTKPTITGVSHVYRLTDHVGALRIRLTGTNSFSHSVTYQARYSSTSPSATNLTTHGTQLWSVSLGSLATLDGDAWSGALPANTYFWVTSNSAGRLDRTNITLAANVATLTARTLTVSSLANGASVADGKTYQVQVRAGNDSGESAWSATFEVIAGVPAAPAAPRLTLGAASLSVTWDAPANNGAAITGYSVEHSTDGTTWLSTGVTVLVATRQAAITGLTDGTEYRVRVRATNANGNGPWSPSSRVRAGAPAAPAPKVVPGSGSLTVSWDAPANNGAVITDYDVRYRLTGTSTWTYTPDTTPSTTRSATLTPLTDNSEYEVQVSATNANGTSLWSASVTHKAGVPAVPGTPALTVGSNTINATWTAPAYTGSSLSYRVEHSTDGTTWVDTGVSVTVSTRTAAITGLTDGTEYSVRVRASNSVGNGPWSGVAKATPGSTVPAAPAAPTLSSGNTQLTVSWTAPASGGSALTGFKVQYKRSTDNTWTAHTFSSTGSTTTTTITGLTNGTGYDVQVAATNANGDSAWSATASVTLRSAPVAPSAPTVTPGDGSLAVTWSAPNDNGASIHDYDVGYCTGTCANASDWSQSPLSLYMPAAADNVESDGSTGRALDLGTVTVTGATVTEVTTGSIDNVYKISTAVDRLYVGLKATNDSSGAARTYVARYASTAPTTANMNTHGTQLWSETVADAASTTASATGWTGALPANTHFWIATTAVSRSDAVQPTIRADYPFVSTSHTLTGLSNGTTYKVRVRAANAVGEGAWSPTTAATPQSTRPDAPAAPTLTPGNARIALSWSAPADTGGSAITDYDVQYSTDGSTWTNWYNSLGTYSPGALTTSETSNSTTGDPIDIGTVAISGVTVTNETISGKTGFYKLGAAVDALRVKLAGVAPSTAGGSTVEARYASTAPTASNLRTHGTRIWQVTPTVDGNDRPFSGDGWTGPLPANTYFWIVAQLNTSLTSRTPVISAEPLSTGRTATITGLTNGTAYQVQVRAKNANGGSPWSASAAATPGLPATPTGVSLTSAPTALAAAWTAPANNGAAIYHYEVRYRTVGTNTWTTAAGTAKKYQPSVIPQEQVDGPSGNAYDMGTIADGTLHVNVDNESIGTHAGVYELEGGVARLRVKLDASTQANSAHTVFARVAASKPTATNLTTHGTQLWSDSQPTGGPTAFSGDAWTGPLPSGSYFWVTTSALAAVQVGRPVIETDPAVSASPRSVTGLTAGTSYEVQVRAVNANGAGPWTASVTGKAGAPAQPLTPTATPASATSLTVTWTAVAGATGYTVGRCSASCSLDASWTTATITGASTVTHTFTGLTAGTAYQVRVSATNTHGSGAWSSTATQKAGVPAAPGAPTLAVRHQSLAVTWTAPNNNGSALTGFKVRYKLSTATDWTAHTFSSTGSTTTTTITGLQNGVVYDVTVAATNTHGDGHWSPSASATPKTVTPDAPAAPTLLPGNRSLSVSWTAPNDNGSTITDYDIGYCTGACSNAGDWTLVPVASYTQSHVGNHNKQSDGTSGKGLDIGTVSITGLTVTKVTTGGISNVYKIGSAVGGLRISARAQNATSGVTLTYQARYANSAPTTSNMNTHGTQLWTQDVGYGSVFNAGAWTPALPADAHFWITTTVSATSNSVGAVIEMDTVLTAASYSLSSLTNGTTYKVRVRAANAGGESAWSATAERAAGAPAAPAAPTITASGNGSLTATWAEPANNGSDVTDYDVRYSSDSGATWTEFNESNTSTATTATVTGLTNNTSYVVSVRAANARGDSIWSPASAAAKPGLPAAPAAPALVPGSGSLTATWPAASGNGNTVTAYVVERCSTACTTETNWSSTGVTVTLATRTATIGGLTDNTSYQVRVRATNAVGDGPWSASATHKAGVPAAPARPTLTPGNTRFDVAWSAPAYTGSNLSYAVEYSTDGTTWATTGVAIDQSARTAAITGLDNGTEYRVRVRASNSVGDGPWSAEARATATPVAPATPTGVLLTSGPSSLAAAWTAPADGGAAIYHYEVRYRTVGTSTWTTVTGTTKKYEPVGGVSTDQADGPNGNAFNMGNIADGTLDVNVDNESIGSHAGVYKLEGGVARLRVRLLATSSSSGAYTVLARTAQSKPTASNLTTHGAQLWSASQNGTSAFNRDAWTGPLPSGSYFWITTSGSSSVSIQGPPKPIVETDPAVSASSRSVGGLTAGTSYEVQVRAVNASGAGPWTASVSGKAGAPAQPSTPTAAPASATSLTVTWTAVAGATGYTVGYCSASCTSDASWTTAAVTGASTVTHTFTGLTAGTSYQVRVSATNAHGSGAWSSTATQKAGVPAAPAAPTLAVRHQSLAVTWTAPNNNGSALTGFKVRYKLSAATDWTDHTFSSTGSTTTTTINGLQNGGAYDVAVAATNTHGDSAWSPSASATPAKTAPDAPAAPTLGSGNASLTANWAAPTSDGGSALTDYDVRYRVKGTSTWTEHRVIGTHSRSQSTSVSFGGNTALDLGTISLTGVTVTKPTLTGYSNVYLLGTAVDRLRINVTSGLTPCEPDVRARYSSTAPSGNLISDGTQIWQATVSGGGFLTPCSYSGDAWTGALPANTYFWVARSASASHTSVDITVQAEALSTATSRGIGSLTNNTEYEVQVRAENALGAGAWSATSTLKAGLPAAPAAPSLNSASAQLSVSWAAPSGNGSNITAYDVEYCSSNCSTEASWSDTGVTVTSATRTATITGLTNGTAYQVRVRATNSVGDGPWSATATGSPGAPAAPAAPTFTASGNGSLTATWTAPANNGSAITAYSVEYSSDSGTTWSSTNVTVTLATRTAAITGLTNGTSYQVRVRATNARGTGQWSPAASETPGKPQKPAAPTVSGAARSLSVSWTAPTENGLSITDYDVQYRLSTATDYTDHAFTGTGTSTTISGLLGATSYQVRVRASSTAGAGPWSDAAAATATLAGKPDAPAPALTSGATQITVAWATPHNGGAALSGFKVQYKRSQDATWTQHTFSSTGSTTSTTISGLTNGTAYDVQVLATNTHGDSVWSATASATAGAPDAPSAPTLAQGADATSLSISWSAPTDNGAAIDDYDLRHRRVGQGSWSRIFDGGTIGQAFLHGTETANQTDNPVDFGDLSIANVLRTESLGSNRGIYKLLAAVDEMDLFLRTWDSTERFRVRTHTSKPTSDLTVGSELVAATSNSRGWVGPFAANTYLWALPASGSETYGSRTRAIYGIDLANTTASYSLAGLSAGTAYEVQVRAANSRGDGLWSPSSTFTPGIPQAPATPTLTPSSAQLAVSWTAPTDGGSAITGYKVQYKAATSSTWLDVTHTGTGTTATISTLTNGTAYDVRVRATNTNGDGPWSPVASASPGTAPGAPTAPTLAPGNAQLSASWSAPANTGSLTITDYDMRYRGKNTANWTEHRVSLSSTYAPGTLPNYLGSKPLSGNTALDLETISLSGATVTKPTLPGVSNIYRLGTAVSALRIRVEGVDGSDNSGIQARWSTTPPAAGTLTTHGTSVWTASETGQRFTGDGWTGNLPVGAYFWVTRSQATSPNVSHVRPTIQAEHLSTATSRTISSLTNDTEYEVQVRASNAVGESAWSSAATMEAGVPAAPVVTLASGAGSLSVSWTAPANNGSAVTGYKVEHSADSGANWTAHTHAGTGRTATLTLTNGTAYQVRVRAVNARGDGPWSAAVAATPGAPAAPAAPTLAPGNASISVSWAAPVNNGDAISAYSVEYCSTNCTADASWSSANVTVTFSSRTAAIAQLTNGTAYQVRVRATNSRGAGAWSPAASETPGKPQKPTAPTVSGAARSLSVSWTAPTENGLSVTDYDVQYRLSTATAWTDHAFTGTGTSTTITGLLGATSYRVRVRASSTAGTGPWSDAAADTATLAGVPDAPSAPTLASGSAQLSAAWTAPTHNGGAAVTDYDLRYSSDNGTSWTETADTTDSTALSATIGTLTNGATYLVQVRAQNTHGTGAWSPSASAVVGTPSAPATPTLAAGSGKLTISWTAATDNGAAVDDYDVRYRAVGTASWTRVYDGGAETRTHSLLGSDAVSTTDPFDFGTFLTSVFTRQQAGSNWGLYKALKKIDEMDVYMQANSVPGIRMSLRTSTSAPSGSLYTAGTELGSDTAPSGQYGSANFRGWVGPIAANGYFWAAASGTENTTTRFRRIHGVDLATTTTSYELTGLTDGTSYEVQVRAGNSRGDGVWSAATTGTPVGKPGVPAPTVTSGPSKLIVEWDAPATNGAAITDYDVQYSSDSGANWTEWNASDTSTTTSATITGLTNGTSYQVQVRAANAQGDSAWSASVSATAGAPSAPLDPWVRAMEDGKGLTVSFLPPSDDGGSALTGYDIRYRAVGTTSWTSHTPTSSTLADWENIHPLDSSTEYEVQARARNARGPGEWSDSGPNSTARRFPGAPEWWKIPTRPKLTPGEGGIAVEWTVPRSAVGGAIADYDVRYRRLHWGSGGNWLVGQWIDWPFTGAHRSTTITSAHLQGTYEVQVRARNTLGWSAWSSPSSYKSNLHDDEYACLREGTTVLRVGSSCSILGGYLGGGLAQTFDSVEICGPATTMTSVCEAAGTDRLATQNQGANNVRLIAYDGTDDADAADPANDSHANVRVVRTKLAGAVRNVFRIKVTPFAINTANTEFIDTQNQPLGDNPTLTVNTKYRLLVWLDSPYNRSWLKELANCTPDYSADPPVLCWTRSWVTLAFPAGSTITGRHIDGTYTSAPGQLLGWRRNSVTFTLQMGATPGPGPVTIKAYGVKPLASCDFNGDENQIYERCYTPPTLTETISYTVASGAMQMNVVATAGADPVPPETVSATAAAGARADAIAVSWAEPDSPAAPVTAYEVQYRKSGAVAWTDLGAALDADVRTATITGLAGGGYEVRVRAQSAFGWGDYTDPPATVTIVGIPPSAPTGLAAAAGNESVALSWDDPSNPSITGYEYQMRWAGVAWGDWTAVPASDAATTSHTVTGLDNGAEYRFKIRALSAAGPSKPGPVADPWFVAATPQAPAVPPAAPSAVSLARGDATVTASWPAVAGATSYHVTYTTDSGQSWHLAALNHPAEANTADGTATITIDGADNAATYIVGVRARNSGGDSGWTNSPPAGPYTPPPAQPPAAPAALTATAEDSSVTLAWDDPSNPSIIRYEYQVNHNDTSTGNLTGWSDWTTLEDADAATTAHTFTGLANGREYRYRLRAVTTAGPSPLAPTADPWYIAATPTPP